MATYPVIAGGGEGVCCPCPNMSGCNCDSHCRIECRAANGNDGGLATLCGFDELVDISIPPRKYRHREIRNVTPGTFVQCTFRGPDCEFDAEACPGSIVLRYSGPPPDNPSGHIEAQGTLELMSVVGGVATYKASGIQCIVTPGGHSLAARITAGPLGTMVNGDIRTVVIGGEVAVGLEVNATVWSQVAGGCILAGNESGRKIADTWAIVQDIDADDCSGPSETNGSIRDTGFECEGDATGTGDLPCTDVPTCYGGGIALLSEEKTERVWKGVGCVQTGLDYFTVYDEIGTIAETLTGEDREEDAIARAMRDDEGEEIELLPVPNCADNPAFITQRGEGQLTFAFRKVQVRVKLVGLDPALLIDPLAAPCGRQSADYNVRLYFHRRVLGSSGPFLFYAVQEMTVHVIPDSPVTPGVDESIAYTPWFDVPNEPGWETRAEYCTAELAGVGAPIVCP